MKRNTKFGALLGVAAVALAASLFRLQGDPASLKLTTADPKTKGDQITFKLQLEGGSNGVIYLIQSSTNLTDWETLLSVKSQPGAALPLGDVTATNKTRFYRVQPKGPGTDTNAPSWTNGVNGRATVSPPATVVASWDPAIDDVGVAGYWLYVNGVLVTNVVGNTLSYQFTVDLHQPVDLRIQARDASGNATPVLALAYLPGDQILAFSSDSGQVFVSSYLQTNVFQTNAGFSASRQIARFNSNDRGVAIGDFDRDGILDIIAGGASGDTLTPYFLKGNGDGTFAPPVPMPTSPGANSYMMDAAVGDFDGDGNLDFVVNGNNNSVFFYWGNGDGTFTLEVKNWGDYGRGMAAGDFNEDGRDDLVRGQYSGPGQVRLFLSNGDRTFTESTNLVGQYGSDRYGVAAGDFDEDGHLDVIANNSGSGDIVFYKGHGDGTFTSLGTNGPWANLDVNTYAGLDAWDYNGDGHLDLVMATANGQVFFWPGNGDGTFSTNRVTVATGLPGWLVGISAPPRPARVNVGISPTDPVTNLNGTLTYTAVGAGVAAGDVFRWTFGDQSTNPVAWTFGTNMANMGRTVNHTYTNEGRFLTRLWHTDAHGIQSVRGTWAIVKGAPPVANPGGPYLFGSQAATQGVWYANMDGSASTDDFGIVNYIWNFGDGTGVTNTGPKALHGWPSNGVWTVTLTVVDAARQTDTKSTTVTFTNGAPPVAAISGPSIVDETYAHNGTWTAPFLGLNSTGPVGIWKYAWRNSNGQTGTGPNFQTTWNAVGTNVITLIVTGNDNQTATNTLLVWVKANALPVPVITGPHLLDSSVATNGLWYGVWSGTNSTDDTGIYQYNWTFGDGATGTGATIAHSYGSAGVFPLVLTVVDNGNQAVSTTQAVVVVGGNPPVARITASTLAPEGAQPITFSDRASTGDHGLYLYTWLFPPRLFTFDGRSIDANQWYVVNGVQNDKMIITGQNNWGVSYFFSVGLDLRRGGAIQGQVDTPSSNVTAYAVVGLKNLNISSGHENQLPYAINFRNGDVRIVEYGNDRGHTTNYSPGTSYDFRIETKPGAGARYYLRPSGSGQPFVQIFETSNYSDTTFSYGADVYSGVWGFDNIQVEGLFATSVDTPVDITTPVFPGGTVYLQVVDHTLQTNTASVLVAPVTGNPPTAVLNGPTSGTAGVELFFDGYASTDDYGIASYSWDFGDGSPIASGPAVTHHYGSAGTYTNTLTVIDYAGQRSTATAVVQITGANLVVAVPWQIIAGIVQPHQVYAGKTNTLKAVARGVNVPFTYIWDYGDGTGTVTNSVTNSAAVYNLEATHAYAGADGTPFNATIQVVLTNGEVLSDTYQLQLQPKTLDLEMKVAIDEGLWYLQKIQNRYDLDTNNKAGNWTDQGYLASPTASAVQAFAINGHLDTGDSSKDPYVDTVQRGVNYLLTVLTTWQIGPRKYGDPDGNHNGIGLSINSGRPIYETGPMMDALIAAGRPELVAPVGGINVRGRAFKDLVQDMVDMFAWGQYDGDAGGGWRYNWGDFPDNSAAQWGAIGMYAAEQYFGIAIPDWVKQRNVVWVAYSGNGSSYGYTGPGSCNQACAATTPSGMVQLAFDGVATTNALWRAGEDALANNWNSWMGQNNVYADYAIAKAMRTAVPQPVHNFALNGFDWFRDPSQGLARVTIDRQGTNGSWKSALWVAEPLSTAWSTIILTSSLFQQGPVAVINVKPNPSAIGYPVVFDGSNSFDQRPNYQITDYRWVFNSSQGVDFDHPDAVGPVVTNVFGALSTNTVWLQVRDNSTPQLSDAASVVVLTTIPPYPPVADAGGPYVACVGQDVHLDGSASFTVDAAAGNFIQSWGWEVSFQAPFQFNDATGEYAVLTNGFATAGQHRIGLRVKNANSLVYTNVGLPDMTSDAFSTIYVYDRVITNLSVRPKGDKAQLVWTKVGDYVVVQRSQLGPDHGFAEIGRTDSSYATFLDTNVQYNVEYYYRIYAYQNGRPDAIGVSDPIFAVSRARNFDQRPPTFQSTPLRIARVGQLYEVTLDAHNPGNEPMYFGLLSGPTNMMVNATNGVVDFTPTPDQLGGHPLSFQVTNNFGRDVLSYTLFVWPASNQVPVANANGPYSALIGQPIQFSSAGTADPDGDALRYFWNFGDGSPAGTNPNPTHVYGGIGDYLVTLFVNDGYGGTASSKTHAVITRPNRPPVVVLGGGSQYTTRLGETVTVDGSGSYSLDGNPLLFTWLWGDGNQTTNVTGVATHLYPTSGTFDGSLVVTDNKGGVGTNLFYVIVGPSNQPPVIALTVSTNSPFVMTAVTFDATGTTDPEGDPLAFTWDFGDRSRTTGPLVSHAFQQIGDFTVTLTVNDNHGGVSVATQLIHALNAPPVFTSTPPLIVRAGQPYTYTPGLTDLDGDSRTFQLVTKPATMSVDTNTGALTWLPGTNNMGPNPIVLRATDAGGASTDQSFTLVVTTPLGPQIDLEPTHIAMTNVAVDAQTLALSGTVTVYLRNNGSDTNPIPFTVSVFEDADFDGAFSNGVDRVVGHGNFPAGFPPGGQGWVEMAVSGQALFKDAPLYAFVDSENVVPEYNKLNNIMRSGADADTNTPPVMDLSASYLQVNRTTLPTNAVLTARLGNSGLVPVPANVPMVFYDGDPQAGGVLLGVAHSTLTLAPGMYQDLSVSWPSPAITNHTVFVVADYDPVGGTNLYQEITLSNNTFSLAVDLSALEPPVADAGPAQSVYLGDTVTLNGLGSKDPQGKPLTYRWSLLSIPIGSRTQLANTATATPSFLADAAGPYTAQLVVNDGVLDSTNLSTVVITAVDTNLDYPPTITSTPSFSGMSNVLYTYQVRATDPQGKPLTYSLGQGPAGMTINPTNGLLQWTPNGIGNFFIKVNANGAGGTTWQSYTLAITPFVNLPPQFTSTPVQTAVTNTPYIYNTVVISPNLYTLTYSLTTAPTGMSINAQTGVITWTPTVSQLGGNGVIVKADDGHGGFATQTYNIVVLTAGANGPQVQPIPDQTVVDGTAFATIPLDNYVFDPIYPANQITWTLTGTNKLSIAINSNRVATITYAPGTRTSERVTFLATDPAGQTGFSAPLLIVRGPDNPPVAAIANLSATDTTSITNGTFALTGTADDPDAVDVVAWRIGLYDNSGALVADVTPGPVDAAGYHEGRVPAGGSFGTLDFTLVRNGDYTLMLEVTDGFLFANATAQVALDAQYNIGQLKFSQQDVVLPVRGVGLQVMRSYDSLNTTAGDFGYGWTYAVSDLGVSVDDTRADTQDAVDGTPFSLRTGGSWDVTLTMPDTGRRVTFRFGLAQGTFTAQAYWTPPPGVNATLVPTVSPTLVTLFSLPPIWQVAGEGTDWQAFDWPGFILTTKDGTQYRIDRVDQGDHFYASDNGNSGFVHAYTGGFLTRVTGTGGEHTDFVHSGATLQNIVQFDALNQQQKSILFKRDAQNRINAIYLPSSLDTNGVPVGPPTMTYEYDSNGNLVKANKLIDASNPANLVYATKTYVYGNLRFPHYITEIQDPRGVSAMQTEYDAQGRVTAIIDAFGKRTVVQHNLAAKTETVYDRLGNPTLFAYDDRGNVVVQVDALGGVTRFDHDLNNNLTMQVDPLGNTNLYAYDAAGNQLTHTDPLGNVTVNTYDSNAHLLTTTDPLGHTTVNVYDPRGNLTNFVDAAGNVTSYTFDAANNKTSATDAAGNITRFEYDSQGNLTKQTDTLGNVTTYTYDANGYQIGVTAIVSVAPGVFRTNITTSSYNVDGAPTTTTDAAGNTTRREYDAVGNPTASVDALGNRTEFHYDDQNQLVQMVYPDGTSTGYAYDDAGRRVSSTDRAGRVTYFQYDALGRLVTTVYPGDPSAPLPTTLNEYDAAGHLTARTDERGNRTTFAYDATGRQVAMTNALGYVTTTTYDANGNMTATTDGAGNPTFYLYDPMGRLVRTIFADGSAKSTTYDALGRDIAEVDQAGAATHYEYDALGQLTAVVNPLGQRTEYAYDEEGALTLQRDANGHVTRFANDPVALRRTTTLPSGQISTILFNGIGKPTTATNFNGQVLHYEYDANNLLAAERFPEGNAVQFTYTPMGRRQTITDARGVTRFAYDVRDRLISRTDPDGRSVQYAYDAAGNRTTLISLNPQASISSTQTFTFDALNRLQTVTAPDGGVTRYTYDGANNPIAAQLPNGTVRSNAFDVLNRQTRVENRASTNVLSSYQYTLSATGDRLMVQELGGRQVRYAHDPARQLTGETVFNDPAGRNRTNAYAYDPVGNRLAFNSAVGTAGSPEGSAYLYDGNDQVLAETNLISGEVTFYTYDNNGNTLSQSNSLQSAFYSWNSDNRLSAATITDSNGVHQIGYQYDADGIRVGATVAEGGNTNQITYMVDANVPNAQVLEEWTSVNGQPASLSAAYTYGLGLVSQNRSGARSYYHPDGLGSTRLLTDQTGLPTDSYDYDAFGRITAQTGTTENSYLFAGEQRDKHLGLDYLRARYMSPSLGRFFGRDPVPGDLTDPASRHRYIYARNNPVNFVDPTGGQFDLVSMSMSLSVNSTIEQYQVSFARAGFRGIQRTAKIVNHVINPGVKLQYLGLDMMMQGDNRGNDMFDLGIQLEQTGYTLLQSVIAGIAVETAEGAAKISFAIGPLKGELSLVKGSLAWKDTTLASYGIQDYNADLKKILDGIDKEIQGIEGGPKADPILDQGADDLQKYADKLLGKLDPGPTKIDWSNKK